MLNNGNFLRQALLLDAMASGAMGIVMAAAPGFIGRLLHLFMDDAAPGRPAPTAAPEAAPVATGV